MKSLNVANLDELSRDECDRVLLGLIPLLKHCKSVSGCEGTAYFIDDKYVVKKYNNEKKWDVLTDIFDAYCAENAQFAQKGYCTPKIYSWLSVPRIHKPFESKRSSLYYYDCDYYVLEERAQGRELFYGHLEDIYDLVQDRFTLKQFSHALKSPQKHMVNFKEIAREYIRDFMNVNMAIEAMPDSVLENFIFSLQNMFLEGRVSTPDIHAKNVISDSEHLMIIDNHMSRRGDSSYFSGVEVERFVITRLMILFKHNASMGNLGKKAKELGVKSEFAELEEINRIFCAAALEKLFKAMRKVMGDVFDIDYYEAIMGNGLRRIVNNEQAQKIMKTLE